MQLSSLSRHRTIFKFITAQGCDRLEWYSLQLRVLLVTFGGQSGNWGWLFAFTGVAILAFLIFDPVERRNFGYGAALAAGAFFTSILPLLMTVPFVSDNLVASSSQLPRGGFSYLQT